MTTNPSGDAPSLAAAPRREEIAKAIVDEIYSDLRKRRLLKLLWDEDGRAAGMIAREVYPMDLETQADIHKEWMSIVVAQLYRAARSAAEDPWSEGATPNPPHRPEGRSGMSRDDVFDQYFTAITNALTDLCMEMDIAGKPYLSAEEAMHG